MASEQDDTVFDQDLDLEDDDDDDSSSQSADDEDDEDRNDILLADDDIEEEYPEEELLHHDATATAAAAATTTTVVPTAVLSSSTVTVASVPTSSIAIPIEPSSPDDNNYPKRHRTVSELITPTTAPPPTTPATAIVHQEEKKPLAVLDDSRRLFQRLWTDEDEIELLRGFLEYTAQRGGATSHQDTSLFYDQIKSKLQLEFNKNQLVEKLRRLKKKYRNVINKISTGKDFSFKSPHDQATFEISSKIWSNVSGNFVNSSNANAGVDLNFDDDGGGNGTSSINLNDGDVRFENTPRSRKRSRSHASVRVDDAVGNNVHNASNINNNNNNNNSNTNNYDGNSGNVSRLIEEAVRSCVGPVFKELLSQVVATGSGVGGGGGGGGMMSGLVMNAMPLGFGGGDVMMVNEKWRKQKILELEVYSKRLELVQEQIRAQLEELRSMGG